MSLDNEVALAKIGLYIESLPQGGGTFQYSLSMLEAVSYLPKERFSVVVGYTSKLWLPYLERHGVNAVFVQKGFWGRAFCLAWSLLHLPTGLLRQISPYFYSIAKSLLRESCDLWIFPAQDGRSYQVPVPALVSIHDLMHRYEKQFPEVSNMEFRLRELLYKNVCRWAEGVLVDSQIGKQQVMESYGLEAERIHILPFIAPEYILKPDITEEPGLRCNLPARYIFYPAQFWEHKNHKRLISAVGKLKRDIPDLKLVLVGSKKNAYDSAVRLVRELNLTEDVIFLDYVPNTDMVGLYRRARALVMPTFFGPTNIPPLEAFVLGCPVAVSDVYGMREQAGDAALFFDPKSIDEIVDCIRQLWSDDKLCARLIERGKKKANEWGQYQFNKKLEMIIEQVLSSAENRSC